MKVDELFKIKKHRYITGRASTGIYLILKSLGYRNKGVIVPANICYAAIFPIIESGNIPIFCDVDIQSGNACLDNVLKVYNENVKVLLIPHMYGNPNQDIIKIKDFCKQKDLCLIEDCASALGASIRNEYIGSFGHYSVFSFGYSKTIDLGYGGIVISDRDLSAFPKFERELPEYNEMIEKDEQIFSQLYRVLRNNSGTDMEEKLYEFLRENFTHIFLYMKNQEIETKVKGIYERSLDIVEERNKKVNLYKKYLNKSDYVKHYIFSVGASPWRYNLLVLPNIKNELIKEMLHEGIPVSDWYPSILKMFKKEGSVPNTESMEMAILNFPLMLADSEIIEICMRINACIEKVCGKNG